MNPKQKTALAISAPIILLILQRFIPAGTLGSYLAIAAQVLAAAIAIVNVFHVPSWVVELLQAFLEVVTPAPATAETVPQIQPALMYRARKIVGAGVATFALMLLTSCGPIPAADNPTNLIKPGIACAEEIILDLAGVSDPAAIVSQCIQFGAVAVSDVIGIASELLAQQSAPPAGASVSPLRARLAKIAGK